MPAPFDIPGDLDTPVSAFLKLSPLGPRFLLESVEAGERVGRYSFIGLGETHTVRLDSSGWSIDGVASVAPASREHLLATLRDVLRDTPVLQPDSHRFPLAGGLVGYAAYDVVRRLERLPPRAPSPSDPPELHYIAPRSLLVFDHVTRTAAFLHDGPDAEREAARREIIALLRAGAPGAGLRGGFEPPTPSLSRAEFLDGVGRVKGHIADGDVYQLVLSIAFSGAHDLSPFEVYRALRRINPSPYMYFLSLGELSVAGSSPEALVRLQAGRARLRPIAGTRPRSADPVADAERERELLADEKENAEHVMLVDLARNDLGRVAAPGTVSVDPFRIVERYSHVMHLVSGVHGELASGYDAFDLFASAFPAGTLSGAPKIRAMEIIDELEPTRRGLYGGTVGYFGVGGEMDHAITIRTVVFQGDRYCVQAGAGIVADSDAETEYDEVIAKCAASQRALAEAARGRAV